MNGKPLKNREAALFATLGHLSVQSLEVTFVLYEIFRRYQAKEISLPCAAYTVVSITENGSFRDAASRSESLTSPEELSALLTTVHDQASQLCTLYSSEIFKNIYLVRWVSNRIDAHYRTVTLKQLSLELDISMAYLCSVLSDNTGCTFRDLIFYRRLFAFTELVLGHHAAVLEQVAPELGYNSIHHFSKIVKRRTGISPSILRRSLLLFDAVKDDLP